MVQIGFLAAKIVENSPHHFIMEWEGGAVPKGAIIGPAEVKVVTGCLLRNPTTKVLGYFVPLDDAGAGIAKRRILVGSDYSEAFNPDGTACERASPEVMSELKAVTEHTPRENASATLLRRIKAPAHQRHAR